MDIEQGLTSEIQLAGLSNPLCILMLTANGDQFMILTKLILTIPHVLIC